MMGAFGCCAHGEECAARLVLILCGGWEMRAGLGRRSHLELKRRLLFEMKGVNLLFVESRRQGDHEWKSDDQKAHYDLEALAFCVF